MNLASYTRNFFDCHQDILCRHYPGLGATRLLRELRERGEDLDGVYFENIENSASSFFRKLFESAPLEHTGGHANFYRSRFEIEPGVFIPRSETEILVEMVLREVGALEFSELDILDVGTGSGNILLSLLQEVGSCRRAVGTDISEKALALARRNAFLLDFSFAGEIAPEFICSDRLASVEGCFHVIVSNPPYIKSRADRLAVHPQVDRFEPHSALYLEDSRYDDWHRIFFDQVQSALIPGGVFLMEGHENHLGNLAFPGASIEADYSGRDRFLLWRKPLTI